MRAPEACSAEPSSLPSSLPSAAPAYAPGSAPGSAPASASPPFPRYIQGALQRECALEFADWRWLCSHALDSEGAALEYFYLSPFYVEQASETLNERMRRGERLQADLQGLLFSVSYSNLDVLRAEAPQFFRAEARDRQAEAPTVSDFAARCTFFNAQAIFHITLLRRESARHGATRTLPLRVYAVVAGKIYRLPPLFDVLQQKMAAAMSHLETCFDLLQSRLARWSLADGYTWADRQTRETQRLGVRSPTGDAAEAEREDFGEAETVVTEVFRRPGSEVAARVLVEEQRLLAKEVSTLAEQRKAVDEKWRLAREAEAKLAAALEKTFGVYRQQKTAQLKQLAPSQQLAFLLEKRKLEAQAAERMQKPAQSHAV
ncbi:mediator complex subunit MED6 [Toxoplasma gondii GT1]|uniref:Mediator of RNA polymerase II transcription subunit 6 n=7 Tax=Toxoplasma gondii TaxID=5811 RepID=S7UME4_TOXGG|nr:mediator complex subunit MED6 [Toxoplasma gondii GT1]KAF4639722.1 mediator complex subunit MED6 [Toxoplasma gondii]KFG49317.1 mediator complex subunit MED6 [Toxoplasma gondii p89]KFG56443.1 mediator complex subunit MED6 [Toxoplasma gondii FOU]KFH18240.1 mediator complex subunit MED6 [Toxoplasma gondii MAS]PUA86692.1 mediator complex subunit MED6 [Toxoplasma gondii TgCATBr9]RQX67154.1 mediator complex subunit MED6 [Toxoplasma gondii CAST]